jgi:hypothetical protein
MRSPRGAGAIVVPSTELKNRLKKETALLVILGFVGLAVLPLAIWFVGQALFGGYESGGLASFFGALQRELRQGEPAAWFLLLSPWLLWQLARLTLWGFRQRGQGRQGAAPARREEPKM